MTCSWKPGWEEAKKNLVKWWNNKGLVLYLRSPRSEPIEMVQRPSEPRNLETYWLDPNYRCSAYVISTQWPTIPNHRR